MGPGDFPVQARSQVSSQRWTIATAGVTVADYFTIPAGLPRQFVYANLLGVGGNGNLAIDIAYRLDAAGAPDWLLLSSTNVLPFGGGSPFTVLLTTGASWIRLTTTTGPGQTAELAVAAFV